MISFKFTDAFIILLYPAIIHLSYQIIGSFHGNEYKYKDSECLLKMVYESNFEHWQQHDVWRERGFDSDCVTAQYFKVQQQNNVEYLLSNCLLIIPAIIAIIGLFRDFPKSNFIQYAMVSFMATNMIVLISHYQQDVLHLCGNVMHHTNFKDDSGANETLVNTIPHGVLSSFFGAEFLILFYVFNLFKKEHGFKFQDFIKVFSVVFAFWITWNMKVVHGYIHKYNQTIYPWPLSFFLPVMRHITLHHVTGRGLGWLRYLCNLHELLFTAQAEVYKHGFIIRNTTGEIIFNYALDLVNITIAYFFLWIIIRMVGFMSRFKNGMKKSNSMWKLTVPVVVSAVILCFSFCVDRQKKIYSTEYNQFDVENTIENFNITKDVIRKFVNSPCKHPIMLRNAINLEEIGCHKNHSGEYPDYCMDVMKNILLKLFGDKDIKARPFGESTRFEDDGTPAKLGDFLLDERFSNWWIPPRDLQLMYDDHKQILKNDFESIVHVHDNDNDNYVYLGVRYFIARGIGTGTPWHAAEGKNVFILLGGKKRFVSVHPAYFKDLNCTLFENGITAGCYANLHDDSFHLNIDIDRHVYQYFRSKNVSIDADSDKIIDVIVNPGDILINCAWWPHIVQNLAPENYALTLRWIAKPLGMFKAMLFWCRQEWLILLQSLTESVKTKFTDMRQTTWIDMHLLSFLSSGPYNRLDRQKMDFRQEK